VFHVIAMGSNTPALRRKSHGRVMPFHDLDPGIGPPFARF
jgi:hypothetical protein